MLQATVRRDGSSRFGANNKYGVFPSVSLGWNVTNETFMENTKDWLSSFKIRFSWGKNGNDNIGDFAYTTNTTVGGTSNNYFGSYLSIIHILRSALSTSYSSGEKISLSPRKFSNRRFW